MLALPHSKRSAITGKMELEYEGELVGGAAIARELIRRACDATLTERAGDLDTEAIQIWFDGGGALQVADDVALGLVKQGFDTVPGLAKVAKEIARQSMMIGYLNAFTMYTVTSGLAVLFVLMVRGRKAA